MPDERLDKLAAIAKSGRSSRRALTFVDIAGLVRGASKGEGLGNQFLSHIREVDAIAHVLRCFEDDDITHVENRIDPLADAETVETELMLADLESLEKRIASGREEGQERRQGSKSQLARLEKALAPLRDGKPARIRRRSRPRSEPASRAAAPDLQAGALRLQRRRGVGRQRQRLFAGGRGARPAEGAACVVISAKIEAEIAGLPPADRDEFLAEIWASRSRASTGSSAPATSCSTCVTYLHRRPQGSARLDDHARHQGAAGRRRHPHRLREGLHPRRDHRLRRLRRAWAARAAPRMPARCGSKARSTSSRTAT